MSKVKMQHLYLWSQKFFFVFLNQCRVKICAIETVIHFVNWYNKSPIYLAYIYLFTSTGNVSFGYASENIAISLGITKHTVPLHPVNKC